MKSPARHRLFLLSFFTLLIGLYCTAQAQQAAEWEDLRSYEYNFSAAMPGKCVLTVWMSQNSEGEKDAGRFLDSFSLYDPKAAPAKPAGKRPIK